MFKGVSKHCVGLHNGRYMKWVICHPQFLQ
jgi:hypothetical protein